ncbi:MAG: TIGR03936 family radical SAM-associated protein [Clostridiales bacterium]|nr:TIGR03936 family radical SAM-associated protein [Clostridiales bacterium]
MKIRFKYRRWGVMKYIGHLDMMRYFQKAMRRADIDICYSEGFSPHQIMSFATPIGVGVTSDGEYFDIQANSMKSSAETIDALNATMADGVEVTECVLLPDDAKKAMSIVAAADYRLSYKEGYESPLQLKGWQELICREFDEAEEFIITKKTKKSERQVDLKPLVYQLEVREEPIDISIDTAVDDGDSRIGSTLNFYMQLSAGSTDNIKPELVIASLYERAGLEFDPLSIQVHRMEVYATDEESGKFVPLSAFGKVMEC